ncbi:DUF4352 domain-containing protein [Catenuloplanes atrovinosus]|uniref:DUF4352 domain-containing protein n=1 Tax=Catenuloplanes atrovinosus TaxID=137266 RepID=A0AAE4CE69_9ACTN|nr:DUF4352 domain-containing protein [Catenuloplanes atrovinosus]MDR7279764.1 hypothetical protein [Catenuloplanes atrovinosus]
MSSDHAPPLIPFSSQGAKLALIVGLAAAVVSACCCLGAGLAAITWGHDLYRAALDRLPTAGLNQPVRDERTSFTVHALRCGILTIDGYLASQSATGQFCVVELSASNLGTRRVTISDAAQRAVLASGRVCTADTMAGVLANGERPVFPTELRPGRSVTGLIVFDIPHDAEIRRLELHESPSSGGVRVTPR